MSPNLEPDYEFLRQDAEGAYPAEEGWHRRRRGHHKPSVQAVIERYLGTAYTVEELTDPEFGDPPQPGTRAYPVPVLEGATFSAATEADLPQAAEALLHSLLPGFDGRVSDPQGISGALHKYGIFSVSVPVDAIGELMYLSLQRRVRFPSEEAYRELRRSVTFPSPIEVAILVATYSNRPYPNPKHWFYL